MMLLYSSTVSSLVLNPPSITPSDDPVDVIEGNDITLTCTRDDGSSGSDVYQWALPDGTVSPDNGAPSPVSLDLVNVFRNQSGVYTCNGERVGSTLTIATNVTLNVQCEFMCNCSFNNIILFSIHQILLRFFRSLLPTLQLQLVIH